MTGRFEEERKEKKGKKEGVEEKHGQDWHNVGATQTEAAEARREKLEEEKTWNVHVAETTDQQSTEGERAMIIVREKTSDKQWREKEGKR